MGQNIQQKVREGDCMIVATDGLYDNVLDAELVSYAADLSDPTQLAEALGELASRRGVDKSFRSPFMQAAEQAGVQWQGGKADDITVVVARIVDAAAVDSESLLSTIPGEA